MSESKQAKRRYVVIDTDGNERLVKAVSPAAAIVQVYEPKVKLASGDDIERLLTQTAAK